MTETSYEGSIVNYEGANLSSAFPAFLLVHKEEGHSNKDGTAL